MERPCYQNTYECVNCLDEWATLSQVEDAFCYCQNCHISIQPHSVDYIDENYEDDYRYYGYFSCKGCQNTWTSAYAWVNYTQKCQKCLVENYAYAIRKRNKPENEIEGEEEGDIHHRTDLCKKCKKFGDCRKLESSSKTRFSYLTQNNIEEIFYQDEYDDYLD